MNSIDHKLKEILVRHAKIEYSIDQIHLQLDIGKDLMLDSIDLIRLVVDIEKEFNIVFEESSLMRFFTYYEQLLDYLTEKLTVSDEACKK